MLRNFDKPGYYQKVCRFFNAKDIEKSFIEFDRRLSGFVQDLKLTHMMEQQQQQQP